MANDKDVATDHDWLRALYDIAHSDTRWAKEQSWRIVNWSLALYGGTLALARALAEHPSPPLFYAAETGIFIAAALYLADLYYFADGCRNASLAIEKEVPTIRAIHTAAKVGTAGANKYLYMLLQLLVLGAGLAFAILSLWALSNHS